MKEYCIELTGTAREDGSVVMTSQDLPMFSVVGSDEKNALAVALQILPEYLRANVPQFVDIRPVANVGELMGKRHAVRSPTHVIATFDRGNDAHGRSVGAN